MPVNGEGQVGDPCDIDGGKYTGVDSCAIGLIYSAGDNFVCFKETAMPGEGGPGAECAYINQCQKGTYCAAATALANCPTPSCCTPYCPVSEGNGPCAAGEDCVAFFVEGMAPPGLDDVGVCALPG